LDTGLVKALAVFTPVFPFPGHAQLAAPLKPHHPGPVFDPLGVPVGGVVGGGVLVGGFVVGGAVEDGVVVDEVVDGEIVVGGVVVVGSLVAGSPAATVAGPGLISTAAILKRSWLGATELIVTALPATDVDPRRR
jgi:hypothetical protein